MPRNKKCLEIGNLVCRVGLQKVLLDIFEDIIWPSIEVKDRYRSYGATKFKFLSNHLIKLGMDGTTPVVGMVGRFVKDTVLSREQVLVNDSEIVHDPQSMRSSPASLFLLILNTHRLIYVKETRFAPSLSEFKGTFEHYVRMGIRDYINFTVSQLKRTERKKARARLKGEFISLKVSLNPITCKDSIEEFVDRFRKIQTLKIKSEEVNNEIDNSEFLEGFRAQKTRLKSSSAVLIHRSNDGLDQNEVKSELHVASKLGNQTVVISGEDDNGNFLTGDSENLAVRKSITELSQNTNEAAVQMFDYYKDLEKENTVSKALIGENLFSRITKIIERYLNE